MIHFLLFWPMFLPTNYSNWSTLSLLIHLLLEPFIHKWLSYLWYSINMFKEKQMYHKGWFHLIKKNRMWLEKHIFPLIERLTRTQDLIKLDPFVLICKNECFFIKKIFTQDVISTFSPREKNQWLATTPPKGIYFYHHLKDEGILISLPDLK